MNPIRNLSFGAGRGPSARQVLRAGLTASALWAIGASSHVQGATPAAPFQPMAVAGGTLRVWGQEDMSAVVKYWAEGFRQYHPEIKVEPRLMGSATAVPGLYSGQADIALLGRENNVTDDNGFSRPKQYKYQRFELMNGSLDVAGKSAALAVFVHRDNPILKLTLAQLAAIAGCDHRKGARAIRTWGQLGATGAWVNKPVRLYTYDTETGTGLFFLGVVLNNSRKLNWDRVKDYKDIKRANGSLYLASEQIINALKTDPYGVAVSSLRYATAEVKPLAIAAKDGGPFVLPTRDTLIARTYPLGRRTYAFVDQPPGKPLDPKVKEFLRYTLSREGQADIERERGYLPLSPEVLAEQRDRVERLSTADKPVISPAVEPALRFVDSLPLYEPTGKVTGTISLWGHGSFKRDFMGKLVQLWIDRFHRYQPDVAFEYKMYGTASAIGALYTGAGNIAILGEEITTDAAVAFQRAKNYAPTGIQIATGSLDAAFFDYAHMIFVNKDNPLDKLTLAQLEAIFGTEHKRGLGNIRTWGEIGLTGEWANKRIQPYSWKIDEDFALFFREAVLKDSHRWNVDVKEYVHATRADGSIHDHGQQILDELAHDRFGIAISNVRYANPQVKALVLARQADGPFYGATHANLISQDYPLTRIIPAFIDRAPGQPAEPAVREFLRFILSREGQQALVQESGYLPLSAEAIRDQLEKLN